MDKWKVGYENLKRMSFKSRSIISPILFVIVLAIPYIKYYLQKEYSLEIALKFNGIAYPLMLMVYSLYYRFLPHNKEIFRNLESNFIYFGIVGIIIAPILILLWT